MTLAQRVVRSGLWMTAAHAISLLILAGRSIGLARMLPVETFGIYAFATAIVFLVSTVSRWGMDGAFLHRSPETTNVENAAATHFILHLVLAAGLFGGLALLTLGFASGELLTALLALAAAQLAMHLTFTPQVILYRRVAHERVAVLHVARAAVTSAVALLLAWHGATLWALLAIDLTAALAACAVYYGWRPVWRPRIRWHGDVARYLLRFGSRNLLGQVLHQGWQRVDKLTTGLLLGQAELGFYARAYGYGAEPGALVSRPLGQVVAGTLAALKDDRARLSSAVQGFAGTLFRLSCGLAGMAALAAPELVTIVIGERWLPMVPPFQVLVLAFAVNPLTSTLGYLTIAVGRPDVLARMHLVRLVSLIAAVGALAPWAGILGIAAGVSLSVAIGLAYLLRFAHRQIDLSLASLLLPALAALTTGLLAGVLGVRLLPPDASDLSLAAAKAVLFLVGFAAVLAVVEGRRLAELARWLVEARRGLARSQDNDPPQAEQTAE